MSEWYADEKPSGKPFEPPAQEEEVDVTYDEAGKSLFVAGPLHWGQPVQRPARPPAHPLGRASPRTLHCFGRPAPAGAAAATPFSRAFSPAPVAKCGSTAHERMFRVQLTASSRRLRFPR